MNTAVLTDNAVVPRITAIRKANGVEADAKVLPHVAKSPSFTNTAVGSKKVPNSSATIGKGVQQSFVAGFPNLPKYDTYAAAVMSSSSLPLPKANVDYEPSTFDLVSVSSYSYQLSIMVDTIKCYVESQWAAAVDPNEGLGKLSEAKIGFEAVIIPAKQSADSTMPNVLVMEEATLKQKKLKFRDGQQYITPNHIQVPQVVKGLLQFGSLDASYLNNSKSNKNSNHDETYSVLSSCNQVSPSIIEIGNSPDHSQTQSYLQEPVLPLDSEVSRNDELMHEKEFAVASICPIVQPAVVHVPSLSNQESPATTDARNDLDQPQALLHVQKQQSGEHSHALSDVEGQVLLSQSKIVDNNRLEHEQLPATATLYPFVQSTLMPGSPLLLPEELDPEARLASSSSIELGIAVDYLNNSKSNKNSNNAIDPLGDVTDGVPSSSNQETLSTGERRNYPNHPQALPSECYLMNKDQLKHKKLPTAAPSYPVVEYSYSRELSFPT